MNSKQTIFSTTIFLSWISSALLFVFYYPFSFNYEINMQNQYYLLYVPVFSLLLMIYLISFPVVKPAIVTVTAFLITIGSTLFFSEYYSYANEHFFVLTSVFTLSLGVLFINQFFLKLLFKILLLIFFYELYLGFSQYINVDSNYSNAGLGIKGNLQNSGAYACYLVVQLPIFLFVVSKWKPGSHFNIIKNNRKCIFLFGRIIFAVISLLTIFIIIQTKSRTAYIAVSITTLSWLLLENGNQFWKKVKSVPLMSSATFAGIITIIIACGYYLFGLKKMSAVGRLLCADVTWRHIKDDFWIGTGIGRFTWYYPQWQAQYFHTELNPPIDYFLSAGESYIIFNEYLQLFKEVGFIGFILLNIAIILFFRTTSSTHKKLLRAMKLCMIAILSSSVTSYPFHVNVLLLLMGFCGAIAYKISDPKKSCNGREFMPINALHKFGNINLLRTQRCLIAVSLVVTSLSIYRGFTEYFALLKWQTIIGNGTKTVASSISDTAPEDLLSNNGKFLSAYGLWLTQDSAKFAKATQILEKARTYFISRSSIEYLAIAYSGEGNYEKSIEQWQWVSNYLPNRFLPRYELMNIYLAAGDTISAKKTARSILNMPGKFYTGEVERIKLAARYLIR